MPPPPIRIALSHNAGHIAIAVFIKDSPKDATILERARLQKSQELFMIIFYLKYKK